MFLVSACLCGIKCKYNGHDNFHPVFAELVANKKALPVCPEQLGGLPTPREPSEICLGNGQDVLSGKARVITKSGKDVSRQFLLGAYKTLAIAQDNGIKTAILKSRSPSCGFGEIYDGSFSSCLRPGMGVTAALLANEGIIVLTDEDYLRERVRFESS
ncbi:MAG: DUF523 domain-containing protein [Syntrophomonadaceae bacterium]